jgi:hypothetical protein
MATSSKTRSGSKNGKGTRKSPGSTGQGEYYHVELRRNEDFATYRTQDVGAPGHIQRVAGKREGGPWATVKWLIGKEDAHVENGTLVGDTKDAKDLLKKLRSKPVHISGDRFEAKPRRSGTGRSSSQRNTRNKKTKRTQTTRSRSK